MSRQYNKAEKRKRRLSYIKRRKTAAKKPGQAKTTESTAATPAQ